MELKCQDVPGSMWAVTTYLLYDRVIRVKCANKELEGFWPGPGLKGAKESDEDLLGGVAEHHRGVCECFESACLDVGGGMGAGLEDQPSIVFEDVASDGANLVTLLGHRGEDMGEVTYVVWHALILVQPLQTTTGSTSAVSLQDAPNDGHKQPQSGAQTKSRTYNSDLALDRLVVDIGRVAERLHDLGKARGFWCPRIHPYFV